MTQNIFNVLSLIHKNQPIVDEMSLTEAANEFVNLHSGLLKIFDKFTEKDLQKPFSHVLFNSSKLYMIFFFMFLLHMVII